jgi:hypothetical protein
MAKKKLNRYQFLKKVGFTGPALLAVIQSCSQKEDYSIESLIVNKNGGTSGRFSSNLPFGKVSTADLTKITSPLVKFELTSLFYCTDHGVRFVLNGSPLNTIARSALAVYTTANFGKNLVIY